MRSIESNVRSYCRTFPDTFVSGEGSHVYNHCGDQYLDFLSGCGSLNYGHNHPKLKEALLEYIRRDGLAMSMDLDTSAKRRFLNALSTHILAPRAMSHRVQFTGPTGTNAIEAAIKVARKATGRTNVVAFTNGFHGCSLGALALTGSSHHRGGSSPLLSNVSRFPYDGYLGDVDTASYLERMISDPSSGCDRPAAIVLETIQGEGGLRSVSQTWAQDVQRIARAAGAALVVDDIQSGCGRSGDFFSFEALGIDPDIVCLAKSISGFGLPMSLVLLKPEFDVWSAGEHSGTFRGNNHAFVTAATAIELFWSDGAFAADLGAKIGAARAGLDELATRRGLRTRGRGLMIGIDCEKGALASKVRQTCFDDRLIVEACGPEDEVLKLLPPLTSSLDQIGKALEIIDAALDKASLRRDNPRHMELA